MPEPDFIATPVVPSISVALEPTYNVFNSLSLLIKAEWLSGFDEWVARTLTQLTPEQRHRSRLVLMGLYYAVMPDRSWPSFPVYVDYLASVEPVTLRDRLLETYNRKELCEACDSDASRIPFDVDALLASFDTFLAFLQTRFSAEHIDVEIEREAHRYLNDPPAMQEMIVSHLRYMWKNVLASEWERVLPMLQTSVEAFRQLNLGSMTKREAIETVLRREAEEHWVSMLASVDRLIFVPSAHVGPYYSKFKAGDTLRVIFGARIPEGVHVQAPDLSRADILVRLSALADDTRLRILKLISDEGELSSPDIIDALDLSQSAASRHLKQLSATGYLVERRCGGSKCYVLNAERVENTLQAVLAFLLGPARA